MSLADWRILLYVGLAVFVWHEWQNFEFPREKDEEE
jgi:hypothetical protein